jgi:hypothetical protein
MILSSSPPPLDLPNRRAPPIAASHAPHQKGQKRAPSPSRPLNTLPQPKKVKISDDESFFRKLQSDGKIKRCKADGAKIVCICGGDLAITKWRDPTAEQKRDARAKGTIAGKSLTFWQTEKWYQHWKLCSNNPESTKVRSLLSPSVRSVLTVGSGTGLKGKGRRHQPRYEHSVLHPPPSPVGLESLSPYPRHQSRRRPREAPSRSPNLRW